MAIAFIIASMVVKAEPEEIEPTEQTTEQATEEETSQIIEETVEHWTEPHREYIVELTPPEVSCIPEFKMYDIPMSEELQRRVYSISHKYKVADILIYSIIRTESNYRFVVGDNGNSIGFMQIQPRWWSKLAAEHNLNIYDEGDNIEMGVIIFKSLLDKFGTLERALKAYNGGKPDGTNDVYVERVKKHYSELMEVIYG